jgi:hypothetical protein
MCSFASLRSRSTHLHLIAFALILFGCIAAAPEQAAAQTPLPGSIQGYVAVSVAAPEQFATAAPTGHAAIAPGSPIYVPDIKVTARNVQTRAESAPVVTNAQGYFRTAPVPPGEYEICVSGTGFVAGCLDRVIQVFGPVVTLGEIVPIRPDGNAIVGTVTLSDHQTPCFFFRPAFSSLALTAKASLLTIDNKPVAGPVKGNTSGQYVLPVSRGADRAKLHVECDASVAETPVVPRLPFTEQNVTISASLPRIIAFDFSKGGSGIRRADPGDTVTASVLAEDPDGNPLHYSWVDDSGRALALPDAPTVQWPLLNANTLNTLHVYVSNTKGGVATFAQPLQGGPNENFFSGHVFNRQTRAAVAGATIKINGADVTADTTGNFRLAVPDAPQFVLNVTHPGFALASLVLRNRVVGIQVPLDQVQIASVNGGAGGTIDVPPGSGCDCKCVGRRGDEERFHILVEIPETRIDIRHDEDKTGGGGRCVPAGGGGSLSIGFQPASFVTASGTAYTGSVSVEVFQYDLTTPNPIPGDFGAVFQGKQVRMGTFGAFQLLPRDAQGQPLAMAAGKRASVSLPIQPNQRATAPATIPLFHYDENKGQWIEDGTLTRSGDAYVGEVTHFSVFNADTVFPGGACVKVLLSSFAMPVTLDATYFDPSVGSFNHNGFSTSDTTIGVERMTPNQNFTLTITDSGAPPAVVSVPLFSGPGLDLTSFPGGLDTDTVNFSHCNGPVQIGNNILPPTTPYFLGPVFGGTIVDNSANYQAATDANPGGTRDTLNHWKAANGFHTDGTLAPGEAAAIYFNNGDLKFGRDMHCRVTNNTPDATACYVSNFGNPPPSDDAALALSQAEAYEASGQSFPQPVATVTMEFDPTAGPGAVQFWAYKGDGTYLAHPVLDDQGGKPIPDICLACHQGTYSGTPGAKVNGAVFLPFDLDSFLDDTATPFPSSAKVTPAVQQQFHLMNNMITGTNPPPGVSQLVQLWYSSNNPTVPFTFNQGAAQLPGQPFIHQPGNIHHEPLYDSVVKIVCRTCHVALPGREWNSFDQMNGEAGFIHSLACAPTLKMPHAEVPWRRFWQQSLSATLASELSFDQPTLNGCPPS